MTACEDCGGADFVCAECIEKEHDDLMRRERGKAFESGVVAMRDEVKIWLNLNVVADSIASVTMKKHLGIKSPKPYEFDSMAEEKGEGA